MSGVITNRELDGSSVRQRTVRDEVDSGSSAQGTATREAHALSLDEFSISQLRQFFELLDEWDRKASVERVDEVAASEKKALRAAGGV
jgi:hypothetical protein